jgi:hypothetical protein
MKSSVAIGRRPLIAMSALVLSLMVVVAWSAPAHAETVYTVINYPGQVRDNRCNGEPIGLNGDLHILTTTTPTANGGSRVRTVAVTQGLEGASLVSNVPYHAVEVTLSFGHYVPPPGTGSFRYLVATLLVPEGDAPTMLLVTVIKGTLLFDGTLTNEIERTYLVCAPAVGSRAT